MHEREQCVTVVGVQTGDIRDETTKQRSKAERKSITKYMSRNRDTDGRDACTR